MQSLSLEQKALVAKNHNLIFSFLNSRELSIEDWYDVAAIGLTKAGLYYDDKKNISFSTFAYKLMTNEILQVLRAEKSMKKIPKNKIFSYDKTIDVLDTDNEPVHLLDVIADTTVSLEDEAISNITMKNFFSSTTKKSKKQILYLLANGYTQSEIAQKTGYSQPQISRIKNSLKQQLKKNL